MSKIEEAIATLSEMLEDIGLSGCSNQPEYIAVELATKLLEKQIPKKPIELTYAPLKASGWKYGCPECKLAIGVNKNAFDYTQEDEYCPLCGQKIDW